MGGTQKQRKINAFSIIGDFFIDGLNRTTPSFGGVFSCYFIRILCLFSERVIGCAYNQRAIVNITSAIMAILYDYMMVL